LARGDVLAQADAGVPVAELCRKYGMSTASFYAWKKRYSGLTASELRRVKQVDEENRKLKRLVADLSLDKQILQDVLAKKI
jgi:putative transposase